MAKLKVTTKDGQWQPQWFHVVVGLFCAIYMITGAINAKFIDAFGYTLPAGILTFPICCILSDLMTEVYGFNRTRQAIWTVLVCTLLFAGFTQLATVMPYPAFYQNQAAFEVIFANTPRLAAAGCLAWLAGEFVNSFVMSKLKVLQHAKAMPLRFIASTAVGQFLDSLVFIAVAFSFLMPWADLAEMLVVGTLFKVAYEVLALPLSVPVTHWVKRLEGVEHFDKQELRIV